MRLALPRLIGITGKAGSGKDTLADHLVDSCGYHKYSLAAPMKRLLNDRFGWTEDNWRDREWKERTSPVYGHHVGPTQLKKNAATGELIKVGNCYPFSPRSWAQWLGTEVGRNIGGPDVWVNMMEREWKKLTFTCGPRNGYQPHMVVPDVRFENEARRIHQLGGVIIRAIRPNADPVADHVSERGVPDELVNVQVENDKDINTYLRNAIDALVACPRGV